MAKKKYRVRIKETKLVSAKDILANAENWRMHSSAQRVVVNDLLNTVGFVDYLKVIALPGGKYRCVDGHMRQEIADGAEVPVAILDLTPEEERLVLATLDSSGAMADTNKMALESLLDKVKTTDSVRQMLKDNLRKAERISADFLNTEAQPPDPEFAPGVKMWAEDQEQLLFSADNQWGIPDWKLDMLSTQVPTQTWAGEDIVNVEKTLFVHESAGTKKALREGRGSGGVLCYYTFDGKFEKIWSDQLTYLEELREYKLGSVVTPDFSIYPHMPVAQQIWQQFRAHWLGRYWQEAGIKIIPSVPCETNDHCDYAFCGVPKHVPVCMVEVRGIKRRKWAADYQLKSIARAVKDWLPETVVIFGGKEHIDWLWTGLPKGPTYVPIESWTESREFIRRKHGWRGQDEFMKNLHEKGVKSNGEIRSPQGQKGSVGALTH